MSNNIFNTLAYKELRESEKGQKLIAQSEADAASFLFDLQSGDKNSEVAEKLSAKTIYDAVTLSSSLTIEVDGETYSLEPYYPQIDEDTALEMLQDVQSSIECSLLNAVLNSTDFPDEMLPGATKMEILDICMPDIVGDYDTPGQVPEWAWVEEKACYHHHKNGQDGVWEFVVNLAYGVDDVPEILLPVIAAANKVGASYILFHQGT